ncbi:acetyl-CoA acetyltransferase [Rhodococcus sp. ARC_M12]|uniref:acetyl-CoA acetyltransferase n=1 Tax=Rhodococcus sp. ARC_M12 TaxID=2928854 RepID=UPI001FB2D719|nr:acetyl-CoA acetyltransferase [Rhodococcus sp. ARC_M12]MCJ0977589.1 acetyl-CoA acetyltransferase [Rhodococcus sp. ARC_M12]
MSSPRHEASTVDPTRVPVIVAIGETSGRGEPVGVEPMELITLAATAALRDSQSSEPWIRRADSIAFCHIASWAYASPAAALARGFGATPADLFDAPIGGQWPARLLDRAAARIASGESTVAVIAGGEAQASMSALVKAGRDPVEDGGWSTDPGGPPTFDLDQLGSAAMQDAGLISPVRIYPLFESRFRFESGLDPEARQAECSELYAAFSLVSEKNPYSWNGRARRAADIGTPSAKNRIVCEPYPLSMNAMPFVDQAACIVVTSLAEARERGVPERDIVYVWGGAGAEDSVDILDRTGFGRSEAMDNALDRALQAAEIGVQQLDVLDVYSCFPIVPTLATRHLKTPTSLIPSVTGGHSSFGGPLSSHSLHSITASVREIRAGKTCALVHANGGYLTYHHSVLLSGDQHPLGYVGSPEPVVLASDPPPRAPIEDGDLTVETVSVEHSRQQEPNQAFVVGRDIRGRRVAAQTAPGDTASAHALSLYRNSPACEIIGTTITVEISEGNIRVRSR